MVEIKSGKAVAYDYFDGLDAVGEIVAQARSTDAPSGKIGRIVVYGGDESQARTGTRVLSWSDIATHTGGMKADPLESHEYDSIAQLRGSMNHARSPDPGAFERGNYTRTLQSWKG